MKVRRVENLPYRAGEYLSDYERERCVLDLYIPSEHKDSPVLVWFHGGAMVEGSKEDAADLAEHFAENGVLVAAASYRLSPRAKYPAYVDDAAACTAWVMGHVAEYGGSPRSIFVGGHSAGAYLAAMVGMDTAYLAGYGVDVSSIAGILPVSGQVFTHFTVRMERGIPTPDVTPVIDEAAPCYHVRKETPPILLICGDQDIASRAEENKYFVAIMKAVENQKIEYREFADRDHGSIVNRIPEPNDPVDAAIRGFISKYSK